MNKQTLYKQVLLDGILEDVYGNDITDETDELKEKTIVQRFISEMNWLIYKGYPVRASNDWVRGLALNVPYNNMDIMDLMYPDEDIYKLSDETWHITVTLYWEGLARELRQMVRDNPQITTGEQQ